MRSRVARTQHVATEDDPWLPELAQAFGDIQGKVATAEVWKILKLSSYGRTMDDQMRLTAVMQLLGWDRRPAALPEPASRPAGSCAGDLRTIWVFICPVTGQISYVGHNPAPFGEYAPCAEILAVLRGQQLQSSESRNEEIG